LIFLVLIRIGIATDDKFDFAIFHLIENKNVFVDIYKHKLTGNFLVIITSPSFLSFIGTNGFLRIASISSRCSKAIRAISLVSGSTE